MGKSSSSLKKKRSRNRSQSRTTKKSKSKSKSRRNKSKKLHHRNHSLSYSDDSDSRSLVSVSSSSSEDDYGSQRSRSRTRKDVKGSKKRVRRRSLSSSESSLDSFRGRKQKRSRSTRGDDSYERRKGTHLKKKPRRGVSVSSASSGSRSCSTCRTVSSNSSDEGEFERRRSKSGRKEKQRKRLGKLKTGTKKSRDRSRSCSSCSRYSECSEYQSEEKVVEQNNLRRLRSVITVINAEKEEIELEGDERKEEILYDHDDYLSSKSNDSNDGGIRREFSQHSHLASEKNKDVDGEQGEKTDASNFRTGSVVGSGKDGISSCDLVGKNDAKDERKSEASVAVGNSDGDNLESILRQRALENLRKFRGGMQTNLNIPADQKDNKIANVNTPSEEKAESVRLKSTREDGARVVTASQVSPQFRLPATRKDSSDLPLDGKTLEGDDGGKGSHTAEHDVASARDKVAPACSPKEKVNVASSSVSIKPRRLRRELTNTTLKQSSASQEHSQAMLIPKSKGNESVEKPPQSAEYQSDNKNGDKIKNVHNTTSDGPSSCPGSLLADVSSDKLRDGTKEGSQFEQKTMSVMRGGELVEVSYKVYIPKKAPALARRQLKR
ncbi:hypothetical protein SLE2022_344490 [Rubroshorea leprosula]